MAVASREFNDFFERLFDSPTTDSTRATLDSGSTWMAPASVWESDDTFHVEMDLPGVEPEAIDVTIEDGRLKIHASRTWDSENRRYLHQERRGGDVTRLVKLPETIDPESISADANHGVLHVTMQKRPEVLPRKIEVRVGQ
ncbi:MAG: Hsp20/alpha crystallin family protein [Planctomycetota bacterium]